jgi:anti-sigma B factor antagonist
MLREKTKEGWNVLARFDPKEWLGMNGAGEIFAAKVTEFDNDSLVVLSGELDMATASTLTHALDPLLAQGSCEVILDLSGLTFIDSSGIAAMVEAQHRLSEKGRELSVHGARRSALRVFEIAGLLEFLHVQSEAVKERPT